MPVINPYDPPKSEVAPPHEASTTNPNANFLSSAWRSVIVTKQPWVFMLFIGSMLVSYFFAFMTWREMRLENGLPDPRRATLSGWITSILVTLGLAAIFQASWFIRAKVNWGVAKRLSFGLLSYMLVAVVAGCSILAITKIWVGLTYYHEFCPAMKACFLMVGIHIIGLLFWLPIHLLLWGLPTNANTPA